MNIRDLLHHLADAVADHVARTAESAEYYDQTSTPLPKIHCKLVRTGAVPGFKVKGRVLVKRSDMHAFIERHRVEPIAGGEASVDEQAVAADLLGRLRRAG